MRALPRMLTSAVLVGVLTLSLGGCGKSKSKGASASATSSSGTTVTARDFMFEPATLSLKAGQSVTITLKNSGGAEHNLSIPDLQVDKDAEAGKTATATLTPTSAGTLQFFCKYHKSSGMTGTIQVT